MDFGILNKQDHEEKETMLPVKRDPFDIKPLTDLFERFVAEIDKMEAAAVAHSVSDQPSCNKANTMTNQAKKLTQTIEKQRKEIKEPYLKITSAIDSFASGLRKRLFLIQTEINIKLLPYMQKLEHERKEEERKAAAKAREEQERLEQERQAEMARQAELSRQKAVEQGKADEEAERLAQQAAEKVEPVPMVVATTPIIPDVIESEVGTSKLKTKPQGFIIDFKLLPDECIKARWGEIEKAVMPWVRAQIAAGLRNIPGVEIKQVVKLETRTRR